MAKNGNFTSGLIGRRERRRRLAITLMAFRGLTVHGSPSLPKKRSRRQRGMCIVEALRYSNGNNVTPMYITFALNLRTR